MLEVLGARVRERESVKLFYRIFLPHYESSSGRLHSAIKSGLGKFARDKRPGIRIREMDGKKCQAD